KDQLSNNLQRESPGPGYIHFPDWIGEWFYEELTYEERGADGKWRKPGKGNNEAFDLFCYAHAVAILRGYEKIRDWSNPPQWARGQDADAGASADKRSSGVADKKNVAGRDERREEASSEALSGNWLSLPRNGGWL
ncbi:phage terminase large subunit family protein, partial [Escherichia coli]